MSSKLDALKAAFAPKEKKEFSFTKFFNFWKMEAGETAIVRFLKDANADNPRQFVVDNLTHSLTVNGKKRVVACLEMHGEECPICELSRQFYDEARAAGETKENPGPLMALGKKYYRKKEHIGQVIVQSSPIEYEKNDGHEMEMPIAIGPQIFKLIQAAFSSGDLDEVPYELKGGYDFRITKSMQGTNANYTLSKFAPKQTDVTDDVIAKLNPYDLNTLRNRKTDRATMEAMLLADRTGQPLALPTKEQEGEDDSLNFVSKAAATAVTAPAAPAPTAAPAVVAEEAESAEPAANKVNDVLAQIRARAAAKAAGA